LRNLTDEQSDERTDEWSNPKKIIK